MKQILFVALFAGGLLAQTLDPLPNDFRKELHTGQVAVPTDAATLATVDVLVDQVTIYNRTASAITATICNRESPAKCLLEPRTSIAAGEHLVAAWPKGLLMRGGLTWVVSASGVEGSIVARKR